MGGNLSIKVFRRVLSLSVLAAVSLTLGGCQLWNNTRAGARVSPFIDRTESTHGGYAESQTKDGKSVRDLRLVDPFPVNLDRLVLPGSNNLAYSGAVSDKALRNRLQDYLLARSDEICLVHKSDILAVSSTLNASFSGITTIAGGIGSIVTGAQAARILSGVAGISNGIRDDLNQNVFYNNFASAIIRQVDAQRQQKMQAIEPKRAMLPEAYSVDESIRDVIQYHNLCSFSEAVAGLATETKRPATADELRGRLEGLRNQYELNKSILTAERTSAGDTPSDAAKKSIQVLEQTNQSIFQMMQGLTLQLGLVQNLSVGASSGEPRGEAKVVTPTSEGKPVSPTANSSAQSAVDKPKP